ncbi:carbohydrate ABC transporter permease [Alkalihalobacillus pseudalcaliphilus]|uniref:carbohydrate ABC transporter permease n=1 Tax=Alkalihalobacillus pseudalcaliphilus TaxID=79884 RepID=UPI00064D89A1|nr:sugar ABC transporter permease [Alkalihalobacillus pseudalcaliphilus]KMK77483.1 ABC transporter permease [Alkalihalobacillus pseudalcaliphilus]
MAVIAKKGTHALREDKPTQTKKNKKIRSHLSYWLFIGPALFVFLMIQLIPFGMGIYYSFTSWNGISAVREWVGFQNYIQIFTNDPRFFDSFLFTTKFMIAAVLISNAIGFTLALILNAALKTKNILRTVYFLPNVIGGLLLGFIWQFIFVRGFAVIGEITNIGFFQQPWLGDAETAFWGLVIVFAWQISGYMMVIYVAALQGLDRSLLEAAKIDGANAFQLLRKIIIPLVLPAFTICLFLTISMAFKLFDLNLALTGGGPYNSTESVALNIYNEAFTMNNYGIGSAKSFIFFVIVAVVTIFQVSLTKKREVEA